MPSKATKKRRDEARQQQVLSPDLPASIPIASNTAGSREDDLFKQLANKTEELSVAEQQSGAVLPKRPDDGGKLGSKERLITNHVMVNYTPFKVLQYDVAIGRFDDRKRKEGAPKKESKDRGVPIKKREDLMLIFMEFVSRYSNVFGDAKTAQSRLVYDRVKFLYTFPQLNMEEKTELELHLAGKFTERDKKCTDDVDYLMKIKPIGQVELTDLKTAYMANRFNRNRDTMQLLDILFRQGFFFENDNFTVFGRSLYNPSDLLDLGCGRELMRGFYQSPHIVSGWKLTLNVDLVASAFYKYRERPSQSGIDFVCELLKIQPSSTALDERQLKQLAKELKGIKFKSTHLGHSFMCTGLGPTPAEHKFEWKEYDKTMGVVSMVKYFKEKYNIVLKYPHWPTLRKGQKERNHLFPIEVLTVAERQRVPNGKLNDVDHSNIIKATAVPPDERKAKTLAVLQQADHNAHSALRNYGLSLNMNLMEVDGRVLNPPSLQYKQSQAIQPIGGVWNMANKRFFQAMPAPLQRWAVIVVQDDQQGGVGGRGRGRGGGGYHGNRGDQALSDDEVWAFLEHLVEAAGALGLQLAKCSQLMKTTERQLDNAFASLMKRDGPAPQWIMSIVPKKNSALYGKLKFLADTTYDVALSNIVAGNVRRVLAYPMKERSLLANFCLKLNTKLGGLNAQLTDGADPMKFVGKLMGGRPVVFFGVDVTHPDAGDKKSPSIAAVCSSLDQIPHKYSCEEVIMEHRVEIMPIETLWPIIKQQLINYFRSTKLKPVNIVYYRDGVSEGQFHELWAKELAAIQRACEMLEHGYQPKITFVVVQKRHHTRLFRKDVHNTAKNTEKNVRAGTTVDTGVVHPFEFDFFLCSHQGLQGTSKPTHYHVLSDDWGYSSDELQMLTFYLCHAFARCTRSVSLPAPVYYAHLIAYRARVRLMGSGFDSQSDSDSPLTEQELTDLAKIISVSSKTKQTMYFQ